MPTTTVNNNNESKPFLNGKSNRNNPSFERNKKFAFAYQKMIMHVAIMLQLWSYVAQKTSVEVPNQAALVENCQNVRRCFSTGDRSVQSVAMFFPLIYPN